MSALRPLHIGVKRTPWRGAGGEEAAAAEREAEQAFRKVRDQVLARDDMTCQFCGWRAGKWQEVHHRDDLHMNNDPDNLVTACRWCHNVHHVGLYGLHGLGVLAVHPDFPRYTLPDQARLHHLFRAAIAAERVLSGPAMAAATQAILDMDYFFLGECADAAEKWLGTSDPAVLGEMLVSMTDEEYDRRGEWLAPVRVVPVLSEEELRQNESDPFVRREISLRAYWAQEIRRRHGDDWLRYRKEAA